MKKVVVLSVVLFASVIVMNAQPRAIGGRFTHGGEVSYQHGLGSNMLQIDVGFPFFRDGIGLQGVITHDWLFPISSWKHEGSWNWYPGIGAGVGLGGFNHSYFFLGIAGMIGIEYNFKFPLQLSLDYRPIIGWNLGEKNFYGDGLYRGTTVALGIRYKF